MNNTRFIDGLQILQFPAQRTATHIRRCFVATFLSQRDQTNEKQARQLLSVLIQFLV